MIAFQHTSDMKGERDEIERKGIKLKEKQWEWKLFIKIKLTVIKKWKWKKGKQMKEK